MRIDFGCRQIRVPQHLLDAAQIRAPFEQMRGESVPQNVGRKVVEDAGLSAVHLHSRPESLARHPAAPCRNEKKRRMLALQQSWPAILNVNPYLPECGRVYGHNAL